MTIAKQLIQLFKVLTISIVAAHLVGCSSDKTTAEPQANYIGNCLVKGAPIAELGYVTLKGLPLAQGNVNPIRLKELQDTATTLGARGALAWRAQQINVSLSHNAGELDHIFNFEALLIPPNVLPPVLSESENNYNQADDDTIRLATKTYRIVKQAHFVSVPPTWRTYLPLNFQKPKIPDRTLLPKDQEEAIIWNHALKRGWTQGARQADAIFAANLSRLKRDYSGMLLYRKLLAENMVSAPFVAKAELGVTGDSHEIRINDRVLRITAHSELQPDSEKWQPILTHGTLTTRGDAPATPLIYK